MLPQAEAFVQHVRQERLLAATVMRVRDRNYRRNMFDDTLKAAGMQVQQTQFRSPNLHAYVERFIQSLGQECMDHFILWGGPRRLPGPRMRGLLQPRAIPPGQE